MNEPYRKKLIEVALPLEAINRESAREKSIRHGHPSTLHLWWARRPLAACRAVLFASIVDDPSSRPDLFPTEEEQEAERQRLFRIIEELVKWENTANETVLEAARAEIMKATDGNPPPVLDPFCGGGSIPLEAQRLGLEAHASDLNPVAVLITKALIEIPPRFASKPPVNPESREKLAHGATWKGAQGLAEDVRYYGKWMRDRAFERIGHLYPKAKLPGGGEATVIAWLWARTVACPNPACGARMPLVRSFVLSTRNGKEAHIEPIVHDTRVRFQVRPGTATREGTKRRGVAECLVCGTTLNDAQLRRQSVAKGVETTLMAIAAEGQRERIYLDSAEGVGPIEHTEASWLEGPLPNNARWFSPPSYGLATYGQLFTDRQRVALTIFSDLVSEVMEQIKSDGGDDDHAHGVAVVLALLVSKFADMANSLCAWEPNAQCPRHLFSRQAIPMVWDFAEGNPFSSSSGSWSVLLENLLRSLVSSLYDFPRSSSGYARQLDATAALDEVDYPLVCTDPPYYDNISYADLSDFFYVWLRRSAGALEPDLFSTLLTPKASELIAAHDRFAGDQAMADRFFEDGLERAFERIRASAHSAFPITLFYAFKQAEDLAGTGLVSTGWDTMLTGLMAAGFSINGTWPMRTEMSSRMVGQGTNALASSIVLACRPRPTDAPIATRREFVTALRAELPEALKQLQHGNIAPVDLAQAAIGPGMAVFSRYAKVLEADGTPMTVRSALALINQTLDEILAEQEGDFDADTRFAVTWFEQHGFTEGPFGEAEVLAKAKDTSPGGLEEAGILLARAGKVRLLRRDEHPENWDPVADRRPTVWEATQHLAHRLESDGGEMAAAELLRRLGGLGDTARELAYRLYTTCERKGWAQDALAYNALVVAWPEISRLAAEQGVAQQQSIAF